MFETKKRIKELDEAYRALEHRVWNVERQLEMHVNIPTSNAPLGPSLGELYSYTAQQSISVKLKEVLQRLIEFLNIEITIQPASSSKLILEKKQVARKKK